MERFHGEVEQYVQGEWGIGDVTMIERGRVLTYSCAG